MKNQIRDEVQIGNYQNRSKSIVGSKKQKYHLKVDQSSLKVFLAQNQSIVDELTYQNIKSVGVLGISEGVRVIGICLQGQENCQISFRVDCQQIADWLIKQVNYRQQHQIQKKQYEIMQYNKQLVVQNILETQSILNKVYTSLCQNIEGQKLAKFILEKHKDFLQFNQTNQNRLSLIHRQAELRQLKQKTTKNQEKFQFLEGYDKYRTEKGLTQLQQLKRCKYKPTLQQAQDDLIVQSLPEVKCFKIWEVFAEMIESQPKKDLINNTMISDKEHVGTINLPKKQKGKFKIMQNNPSNTSSKVQKRQNQGQEQNQEQIKKSVQILKIAYKLLAGRPSYQQISTIEQSLNQLLNQQPQPRAYLQATIRQTLLNILDAKRNGKISYQS